MEDADELRQSQSMQHQKRIRSRILNAQQLQTPFLFQLFGGIMIYVQNKTKIHIKGRKEEILLLVALLFESEKFDIEIRSWDSLKIDSNICNFNKAEK